MAEQPKRPCPHVGRIVAHLLEVGSRYAHILGVTANPHGPWTAQRRHLAGSDRA
jgi:hypothetical protein